MNSTTIAPILLALGKELGVSISPFEAEDKYYKHDNYKPDQIHYFTEVLAERAARVKLNLIITTISEEGLQQQLNKLLFPLLVFQIKGETVVPILFSPHSKNNHEAFEITTDGKKSFGTSQVNIASLFKKQEGDGQNNILLITPFPMEGIMPEEIEGEEKLSALRRFFRLLRPERKDIFYIYVYAILIGFINLSLPLGIQAIIGLISGGLVLNSVVILIALVIVGILVGGGLQIMQLTLVEMLQRRVFAKAAYEFAYRVPRFSLYGLGKYYPPELMNRFFDVVTLQKGLPKILIDLTAAALQILLGLLLLSFYHPFFVFFGIFMIGFLYAVIAITSPKGMNSNMMESKYKYKMAHWLQEMARAIIPFKMAGDSNLAMSKTDEYVNSYLGYRKKHFHVLVNQYSYIIGFKTVITGGLLIMGTLLVVDRQISLGQFVASEIVIVTIVSAIEKIIASMETIYDTLTAVEKMANVTDVPLERRTGFHLTNTNSKGMLVEVKELKFSYPHTNKQILNRVSFTLSPGEKLCISGAADSGKNTLIRLLLGLYDNYDGIIMLDGMSLRDINLPYLRTKIGENILNKVAYDGTLMNNITMGQAEATPEKVAEIVKALDISDVLYKHPQGLMADALSGDVQLSESSLYKLTMARSLVVGPKLVILDDHILTLSQKDRGHLLDYIFDSKRQWSVLAISNDESIVRLCDRQLYLEKGKLKD